VSSEWSEYPKSPEIVFFLQSYDSDVTTYGIRAGATNWRFGGRFIHASAIIMHEEYDGWYMWNDIAIVKLQGNLVYGAEVQPIEFPPVTLHVPAPTSVQLSGWGTLKYQGDSPDIVQTVIKPIVSMESCAASYGVDAVDPAKQICAGEEGRDACEGDYGSGLVFDGQVIGIASWSWRWQVFKG
jgi:trypsin